MNRDNQDQASRTPGKVTFLILCLCTGATAFENLTLFQGLGTLSRILGVAASISGVVSICLSGHLRRLSTPLKLLLTFVCWAAVTCMWTISLHDSAVKALLLAQLFCLTWLMTEFIRTDQRRDWIMLSYVLGAMISALGTIRNYLIGSSEEWSGQYSVGTFITNDLALVLALAIPLAVYQSDRVRHALLRNALRLCVPLLLFAIALTGSRTGLICAGIAIVGLLWYKGMLRWKTILSLSAVLVFAWYAADLIPPLVVRRLSMLGYELSSGDLSMRSKIWQIGFGAWLAHPIAGIGTGAFPIISGNALGLNLVAHSLFVSILVEEGAVGLLLFGAALLALTMSTRLLNSTKRKFYLVLLAIWAVGVSMATWEDKKATWILLGIVASEQRKSYIHRPNSLFSTYPTRQLFLGGLPTTPVRETEGGRTIHNLQTRGNTRQAP